MWQVPDSDHDLPDYWLHDRRVNRSEYGFSGIDALVWVSRLRDWSLGYLWARIILPSRWNILIWFSQNRLRRFSLFCQLGRLARIDVRGTFEDRASWNHDIPWVDDKLSNNSAPFWHLWQKEIFLSIPSHASSINNGLAKLTLSQLGPLLPILNWICRRGSFTDRVYLHVGVADAGVSENRRLFFRRQLRNLPCIWHLFPTYDQ